MAAKVRALQTKHRNAVRRADLVVREATPLGQRDLILEAHATQGFRFLHFYERRARRLLLALFFAIALTALGAVFTLTPEDLAAMCASTLSALFFVANVYFLFDIDYFSPAAETLPMLHTWHHLALGCGVASQLARPAGTGRDVT